MKNQKNKLGELPVSGDEEFWQGEKYTSSSVPLHICDTHKKDNWASDVNQYVDNHDGTVTCKFCSWGARVPGYMRMINGKLIDLRILNGIQTKK